MSAYVMNPLEAIVIMFVASCIVVVVWKNRKNRTCACHPSRSCPQCGETVPHGAKFCPDCGEALASQKV